MRVHDLLAAAAIAAVIPVAASAQSMPAGFGPDPSLPAPDDDLIPTVNIAPADRWINDEKPVPGEGLKVQLYAEGLDHPRWLHVLPNGDVLVAETNAPERPDDGGGLKGAAMSLVMSRAGASTDSADRITLLRDRDGDGAAEERSVFLEDLHSPFGMALIGETLFVANTDAVVGFPYETGANAIAAKGEVLTALPAGPLNHHWTKNIIASEDGARLYVTVGSNSNVGENGLDREEGRAAIWEVDVTTGEKRLFATGLRNPNGMGWEPETGALWTVVNERDEIGDDLPPDYMTSVRDGGFYGWPFSYYGDHVDERVEPQRPDLVASAIAPDYALGGHTASLGLTFSGGAAALPEAYASGAFIGQHGSWNRSTLAGYEVIFVPFEGGEPAGPPVDILTGFVDEAGDAQGRPVGVAIAKDGALLVADDVGERVWRVTGESD